jgi:hypothetical protein
MVIPQWFNFLASTDVDILSIAVATATDAKLPTTVAMLE